MYLLLLLTVGALGTLLCGASRDDGWVPINKVGVTVQRSNDNITSYLRLAPLMC